MMLRVVFKKAALGVATVACTYHCVAITLCGLMPSESALTGSLLPGFRDYLNVTGNWNNWAMFTSAPNYHSFDAQLVAQMGSGEERTFGAMLPGLLPYDQELRSSKLMIGFEMPGTGPHYLMGYLGQARQAIAARTGEKPKSVWLNYSVQITNPLQKIRNGGAIARATEYDRGR